MTARPWRIPSPTAGPAGLLGALLTACYPGPSKPCVEGVEPGDRLSVALLERYDADTTFAYDLPTFFGPSAGREAAYEGCNPTRDLPPGEPLTVDVLKWYVEEDGNSCNTLIMSANDTSLAQLGPAATDGFSWGAGGIRLGSAWHGLAVVGGCTRRWVAEFMVRSGAHPLDRAVPGEIPPVLMMRALYETDDDCSYEELGQACLFVVQLEKLGDQP